MAGSSNILTHPRAEAEIARLLAGCPRTPLLPSLGSEKWRRVAGNAAVRKLAAPLRAQAEVEWDQPMPVLTDELYASFRQSGIRTTFENVYFERRRRFGRAVLSLLLAEDSDPWRDRLASSVLAKLEDILGEVSWALPAHVNWHNDDPSGKEPMQIDLCCADTANQMAEVLDLFPTLIPSTLSQRVRDRLQRQIFENYLERDFHWMAVTHNWNAVCHQGVVGAALSQVEDPSLLARILSRMQESLPRFLEGFGADGGCSEGPGYWNYGFGRFAVLNEQLETRSHGALSLFEGDERVRRIARFGPRIALSHGRLVNFSDCVASGGLDPATLDYLAGRLGNEDCRAAASSQFSRLAATGVDIDGWDVDAFHVCRWMLRFPDALSSTESIPGDCFLPDLALVVARGRDAAGHLWEFAAKGGHNAEHHNHNDCGSFLLNIDGVRLITEIGAPEYVHDYFGPRRYDFLAARSRGHSVPLINEYEQAAGAEYAARCGACELSAETVRFSVDLAGCYPAESGSLSARRTFTWDKIAGEIHVVDDYELERPGRFESAIISEAPPQVSEACVIIQAGGFRLSVSAGPGASVLGLEGHELRGREGDDLSVYRVSFGSREPAAKGSIGLVLRLEP